MSFARYLAEKADHLLRLAKHIKETPTDGSVIELALIALANEFIARAEQETFLAKMKPPNGNSH
jgi:hypothetical protein